VLVTVVIIGVLAALAVPIYSNINTSSREVVATDHLEHMNKAVTRFSQNCWKIPTAAAAGDTADEFTVLRSLQYHFPPDQFRPGSPFFDPRYNPGVSSSSADYRIRWNGNSFELLKPGVGGSGLHYAGPGDYAASPYSFPSGYKPAGAL
jgi:type II secretory pathway pseudopilin PulG